MKKLFTLALAPLALVVAGLFAAACTGPVEEPTDGDDAQISEATEAQQSGQPCRNVCERQFNQCSRTAKNPGAQMKCQRTFNSCIATCG